jgi:hypothetical protein
MWIAAGERRVCGRRTGIKGEEMEDALEKGKKNVGVIN